MTDESASHPQAPRGTGHSTTIQQVQRQVKFFTDVGVVGVWLILLYFCSIWLVLGTLSSYQFQDQIRRAGATTQGESRSVASVVRLLETYENKIQLPRRNITEEIKKIDMKFVQISADMEKEQKRSDDFWVSYLDTIERIAGLISQLGGTPPEDPEYGFDPIQVLAYAQSNYPGNEPLMEMVDSAAQAIRTSNEADNRISRLLEAEEKARNQHNTLQANLDELDRQEEGLLASERKKDYISELLSLKELGFHFLATMPPQLLTLILTLSMGALGSVISLTRTFFDKTAEAPFSFYLFRPFLGMVTAVAVFVLAKAGQITISDTSVSQGLSENLNPFLISFLAVLSGLFSEHAYERIQRAGWALFRSRDGEEKKERWAFAVKAEIEAQSKDPRELAKFARVSPDILKDWLDEKQMVPEEAQDIIAAWLAKDRRALFSDQAAPG